MSATRKKNGRFKVGDWVAFPYGTRNLIAQVAEARGPLGVNRRHLYRILVPSESGEPDSFEMPDDELAAAGPPDKTAIIRYLKEGGLVEMLRSNLNGGRHQPKVWLTCTSRAISRILSSPSAACSAGLQCHFSPSTRGVSSRGRKKRSWSFLRALA
jgi:hypothetical protein